MVYGLGGKIGVRIPIPVAPVDDRHKIRARRKLEEMCLFESPQGH